MDFEVLWVGGFTYWLDGMLGGFEGLILWFWGEEIGSSEWTLAGDRWNYCARLKSVILQRSLTRKCLFYFSHVDGEGSALIPFTFAKQPDMENTIIQHGRQIYLSLSFL